MSCKAWLLSWFDLEDGVQACVGEDAQNTEVQGIYAGRTREHLPTAAAALVLWNLKRRCNGESLEELGKSDRREGEKKLIEKLILMLWFEDPSRNFLLAGVKSWSLTSQLLSPQAKM